MKVQLEEYSPPELDAVLCQFYGEVRKRDGDDYEPDSLRVMQAGLHRYLVENNYPKSIMDETVFNKSIKTLEGKARLLRQNGMGKRPNASQAITRDEEDELWRSGKLGISNPVSLLHTIWFLNIQHFGQRGQQEHASLNIENFQTKTDEESGLVYIEYFEPPTKTRQHGLHPNPRVTNPKMFEIPDNERCPVRIFNFYASKHPSNLQNTGRFYLSPKSVYSKDVDEPWFKSVAVGKNKIATFMKEIISGTNIEKGKKITNHSGRKLFVKKMKAANIPETSIIKITGHKTTEGLKSYDPGDQGEMKRMSDAIVARPKSASSHPSSSTITRNPEQVGHVFTNCTVTFNNIIQKNESSRKRKRVIYSSDSSQSQ
ncbi:zinc finger MYM-type protein 3-like [Clytia hemisphaerica]|uniref:zinc finger MYM-type protein 3-like n=1 Tax=Clytia hemisphaerica TaxID=252671 RepID=UPI0034D56C24